MYSIIFGQYNMSNAFCDLLIARQKLRNDQTPAPGRFEIVNPYINANGEPNGITQYDLAMRRKVEILRYNKTNTIQGQLTKSQQLSGVINNNITISNCPADLLLPTPSNAAGVPGPPIILQYNPDIPLYGYGYIPPLYGLSDKTNA